MSETLSDYNQHVRFAGSLSETGTQTFENVAATGTLSAGTTVTATTDLIGADLSISGLTGSVVASRYVGQTASVAPTTGAHLVGDFVTTTSGQVYVCSVAGTPGTWIQCGLAPAGNIAMGTHLITGVGAAATTTGVPSLNQLTSALTITSGALPTTGSWVSGTAKVNPVARQVTVNVECVFDGTANAATVAIAISADDSTYTTVGTPGVSAAINTVGGMTMLVPVTLPAGWFIKLTIGAHATVAASVYY